MWNKTAVSSGTEESAGDVTLTLKPLHTRSPYILRKIEKNGESKKPTNDMNGLAGKRSKGFYSSVGRLVSTLLDVDTKH